MKRMTAILIMALSLLATSCNSYESPIIHTAKYEIITKGWEGNAIFTDNYTITNEFVILHGYSNKNIDLNSSGDLLIPKPDIKTIQANPYLEVK